MRVIGRSQSAITQTVMIKYPTRREIFFSRL